MAVPKHEGNFCTALESAMASQTLIQTSIKAMVPVVKRLSWVVTVFEAQLDVKTRLATEELLKRTDAQGSAGLMLAQHAANSSAYFVPSALQYKDLELPAGVVQCDVQGSIQVGSCCPVCFT